MREVVIFYLPKHKRKVWYSEVYLKSEHWTRFRAWLLSKYPQCVWCWAHGVNKRDELTVAHLCLGFAHPRRFLAAKTGVCRPPCTRRSYLIEAVGRCSPRR